MWRMCARPLPSTCAPSTAEVRAGTELAARAGDDDDTVAVGVVVDGAERLEQLVPHDVVDRVLLLGPVQRDRDDPSARSICSVSTRRTIIMPMGFNPFRQQRRSAADYAMVVAAFVVVALLVLWALFG